MEPNQPPSLRDLYPEFTDEQLQQAEANLERYLAVMIRIAERLRSDGYDLMSPDLTRSETEVTIPNARSNQIIS